MFNPNVPSKESPFARKYRLLRNGGLAEFEAAEREAFAAYVARMAAEELEEGETNPV